MLETWFCLFFIHPHFICDVYPFKIQMKARFLFSFKVLKKNPFTWKMYWIKPIIGFSLIKELVWSTDVHVLSFLVLDSLAGTQHSGEGQAHDTGLTLLMLFGWCSIIWASEPQPQLPRSREVWDWLQPLGCWLVYVDKRKGLWPSSIQWALLALSKHGIAYKSLSHPSSTWHHSHGILTKGREWGVDK